MKILDLCDGYFLILVLVQSFIVIFIDAKSFKKENLEGVERKAKILGNTFIVLSIILFILHSVVLQY